MLVRVAAFVRSHRGPPRIPDSSSDYRTGVHSPSVAAPCAHAGAGRGLRPSLLFPESRLHSPRAAPPLVHSAERRSPDVDGADAAALPAAWTAVEAFAAESLGAASRLDARAVRGA